MKGAVFFHSKWGNCRQVAERIAEGLREAGHEVDVVKVPSSTKPDVSLAFILVGSPTRIGKMTGPMRRFVKRRIKGEWAGKPYAAFGTGMMDVREKGRKQSADRIHELLEKQGLNPITTPFKAAVLDLQGPLADGELDSALEFGRRVGELINE